MQADQKYPNMTMRSDCPLNYGLEIFGDKWSLLIIRDLVFFDKRYYREFLNSAEGISTNILADRLALLEKEGIIYRSDDKSHKQKVLYRLTKKGIDLLPIIIEIGLWSDKYAEKLNAHKDVILGPAKRNKVKGLAAMRNQLVKAHLK